MMRELFRLARVGFTVLVCLMIAGSALTADNPRDRGFGGAKTIPGTHNVGEATRATLQYDDGVPVSRDGATGPSALVIGNQFNTGLPSGAHTITALTFNLAGFYGAQATVAFFGPVAGTNAPFLGSQAITGLTGTGWVTAPVSPVAAGSGSFLAGVFNTGYGACSGNTALGSTCEGVALGPGTNGWGHHAIRISVASATAASGSAFAPIGGQNALFRVSGGNIPVELMRFEVE